jgi:MFS superfamily sulfate permease-like transporter
MLYVQGLPASHTFLHALTANTCEQYLNSQKGLHVSMYCILFSCTFGGIRSTTAAAAAATAAVVATMVLRTKRASRQRCNALCASCILMQLCRRAYNCA